MAQMMEIKRLKLMRMTRTRISFLFLRKTSMMWRRKSEQLKRSLVDAEGGGGWVVSYFRIFRGLILYLLQKLSFKTI